VNVGLYRSAVAMAAQQRDLDSVASNLANLGTVGFKRGVTAAHELEVQRPRGPVRGLSTFAQVDFTQGNLQRTGRPHDLALYGEGFFAVEGPEGERYTRDGTFHTTEAGILVTEDGFPVAWETLQGTIDPVGDPLKVDGEGNVRQGLQDIGRLRIVDFEDKKPLRLDAFGLWKAPPRLKEIPATGRVEQYALEESNATGVEEMVAMIGIQRSFEVTARVFEAIDKTYERLTRPF
jgi:flagellar basal-body rod protein FlgF